MKTYPLIGIFGGTFDPIHNGHSHVLRSTVRLLPWKRYLVMPCHIPALKPGAVATQDQRIEMLKLALDAFQPDITIDDRELKRNGPTYTIETIRALKQEFPDEIPVLILGDDAFSSLPDWEDWQEILRLTHLIVVDRNHDHPYPDALRQAIAARTTTDLDDLTKKPGGFMYFLHSPLVNLSSTELRSKLTQHAPIDALVPNKVNEYILQHHLYDQ